MKTTDIVYLLVIHSLQEQARPEVWNRRTIIEYAHAFADVRSEQEEEIIDEYYANIQCIVDEGIHWFYK